MISGGRKTPLICNTLGRSLPGRIFIRQLAGSRKCKAAPRWTSLTGKIDLFDKKCRGPRPDAAVSRLSKNAHSALSRCCISTLARGLTPFSAFGVGACTHPSDPDLGPRRRQRDPPPVSGLRNECHHPQRYRVLPLARDYGNNRVFGNGPLEPQRRLEPVCEIWASIDCTLLHLAMLARSGMQKGIKQSQIPGIVPGIFFTSCRAIRFNGLRPRSYSAAPLFRC